MSDAAKGVKIEGDGVAASCCELLLSRADVPVSLSRSDRPKVPAVMLGDSTQRLMVDVFENEALFKELPRVTHRIVSWGKRFPGPLTLPHSAVVVSEEVLLHRLQTTARSALPLESDWTIHTSRLTPQRASVHAFGTRVANASSVVLSAKANRSACYIESLASGWLFLVPTGERSAWLLSVGESVDAMLGTSHLVAAQVGDVTPTAQAFPAYPRISDPLCGEDWLACGTGAIGFDPLCGEGTGNAVREAILAAAVVEAIKRGASPHDALDHYRGRLLAGFARHLQLCKQFYADGDPGAWWDQEIAALDKGLKWVSQQHALATKPRFKLNGFALERIVETPDQRV